MSDFMSQSASVRPDPSLHRKAAIVRGAALDHRGEVRIEPIPNFDLDRTIFQTLEGAAARYVMATRVGREVHWKPDVASETQAAYDETAAASDPDPESDRYDLGAGKLRSFVAYANKVYGLRRWFEGLEDRRKDPTYPTPLIARALFFCGLLRVRSLNALEPQLQDRSFVTLVDPPAPRPLGRRGTADSATPAPPPRQEGAPHTETRPQHRPQTRNPPGVTAGRRDGPLRRRRRPPWRQVRSP